MVTEPTAVILRESVRLLLVIMQRAILEGQVVGKNGDSLANVKILLKANGQVIEEDSTYLSGRFVFPKLKEGKYELFAEYNEQSYPVDKIYLPRGKMTFVRLHLPLESREKTQKSKVRELERINRYYHTLCLTVSRLAMHTSDKKLDGQNLFMGAASIVMCNGAMTLKGTDAVADIKAQLNSIVEQVKQVEKSRQEDIIEKENVVEEKEITRIVPKTEDVEIAYEESHIKMREEKITETIWVPEAVKVQTIERNKHSLARLFGDTTYDEMVIKNVEKTVFRNQLIPEVVKELKTKTESHIIGYEEVVDIVPVVVAQVDKVVGTKYLKGGYPLIKLIIGLGLAVQHYFCDDDSPDFSISLSHGNLIAEQKLSKLRTKIEQLVDEPNGEPELVYLLEKALVN
ncbi:MAG: carboxypeptidase-like regulatory domain-containing protein [Candidatus Parabeggiatoa sp.]|nr:carboxypeptidase-like regulatory domain-containing protein [Candidatus Parabeggiatoa sp.]